MILRAGPVAICVLLLSVSQTEAQVRECDLNSREGGVLTRVSETVTMATLPIITCVTAVSRLRPTRRTPCPAESTCIRT